MPGKERCSPRHPIFWAAPITDRSSFSTDAWATAKGRIRLQLEDLRHDVTELSDVNNPDLAVYLHGKIGRSVVVRGVHLRELRIDGAHIPVSAALNISACNLICGLAFTSASVAREGAVEIVDVSAHESVTFSHCSLKNASVRLRHLSTAALIFAHVTQRRGSFAITDTTVGRVMFDHMCVTDGHWTILRSKATAPSPGHPRALVMESCTMARGRLSVEASSCAVMVDDDNAPPSARLSIAASGGQFSQVKVTVNKSEVLASYC